MRIRTHQMTGILLLQLLLQLMLLFHAAGQLWAESRIGAIQHVSGRNAVISLGIKDGVTVGLRGEIFREEMVEGQQITSKLAELTVTEAYPDSAVIEIRMRFAPVRQGDQVRVDNVIVQRTIVPEEEQPVPEESRVESPVVEKERASKKYRIGLGWGIIFPSGDITQDIDGHGFGAAVHVDRMITKKTALGISLNFDGFPTQRATWTDMTVPPFISTPIQLQTKFWQLGFHVKYFVTESPVGFYLFGGPTFNYQSVDLFYLDASLPNLYEEDNELGLMVGCGLEYPISGSFLLGFEFDYNRRPFNNKKVEDTLEWYMLYYIRGSIQFSYRL